LCHIKETKGRSFRKTVGGVGGGEGVAGGLKIGSPFFILRYSIVLHLQRL